jgi:hypothetical protein
MSHFCHSLRWIDNDSKLRNLMNKSDALIQIPILKFESLMKPHIIHTSSPRSKSNRSEAWTSLELRPDCLKKEAKRGVIDELQRRPALSRHQGCHQSVCDERRIIWLEFPSPAVSDCFGREVQGCRIGPTARPIPYLLNPARLLHHSSYGVLDSTHHYTLH